MLDVIINFGVISLAWSINGYIYKDLLKYLNNIEIKTLYFIISQFLVIGLIIYSLVFNRKVISNFTNNISHISIPLLVGTILLAFINLISSFSYYNLLKKHNITYIIPILRAVSTILITIIGYYYFQESLNKNKIIGIGIIMAGVYTLNIDK